MTEGQKEEYSGGTGEHTGVLLGRLSFFDLRPGVF
jgi:hypothetical protein